MPVATPLLAILSSVPPVLADGVLVAVLLAATWTDLRTRRIPDALTFPAIAAGLLFALTQGGLGAGITAPGLQTALIGAVTGYVIFAVLVVLGWMGGGDAKLMAAVGAFAGFPGIVGVVLFVVIAGGVLGVLALVASTPFGRRLAAKAGVRGATSEGFGKSIPYAPAILLGTIAFRLWLQAGSAVPPGGVPLS